jgi:glycosyltransferase involved in cell wall biosynthesis
VNSPYLEKTLAPPSKPPIFLLGSRMAEDGIQNALIHQARWFYGRGYRVVAAFLGDPSGLLGKWQALLPIPLVNLRAIRPGRPEWSISSWVRAVLHTSRIFAVGEFRIFETFGVEANLFGLLLGRLAGVQVRAVHYPCQPLPPRLKRLHTAAVNRFASHVITATDHARSMGLEDGILSDRMVLVRRGVKRAEEIDYALRRRLRSELEVPDDGCLVLSAGNLNSSHAYDELLQAIPQVLQENPLTRFVILGEGPGQGEMVHKARQLGIAAQMRFPGSRSDLLRLIGAADIYFLPAAFEGLPPYLLEAMAAHRPILAQNSSQVKEFVQPGETAWVIEPGDLPALSNACLKLIADSELRRRLGQAAGEYVQQHYGLERMCTQYAVLLDPSYHVEVS